MYVFKIKVKEKRKRDDHGLKILEVEGKVVAKTTTVEKIGKYDFTMKGENRMVCIFYIVNHRLK